MSHVEHDTLWSLARGELSQAETREAKAHLADCPDCRVSFEDVQTATQLLRQLPEAPPMPEGMARRVGAELAEAADARAARRFTSWWQSLFTPRFVFAAALGAVLVVAAAYLLAGATPDQAPHALATPQPAPAAPAARKLQVTVASAKKATASKAQVLAEGARVSTQKGGSLWMKLPDGSRAGLTAKSEVKLVTLEEKALTLDLERGNLAMVVPHREDRVLTVRAGELVVKDLGTRFLVSREADRTLVAVEEGEVEVTTPRGTQVVVANRAVSWSGGKLTELPWEPTPAQAPAKPQPAAVAATPDIPSTPDIPVQAPAPRDDGASIARLDEDDELSDDAPPPPEESEPVAAQQPPDRAPMATDEQWAQLPPPPTAGPPPSKAVTATERGFTLRALERKLRDFGAAISSPNRREAGLRSIAMAADARDCTHALKLADRWLAQPVAPTARELELRRGVLLQQVRCLNQLGRKEEATALQREIESPR